MIILPKHDYLWEKHQTLALKMSHENTHQYSLNINAATSVLKVQKYGRSISCTIGAPIVLSFKHTMQSAFKSHYQTVDGTFKSHYQTVDATYTLQVESDITD